MGKNCVWIGCLHKEEAGQARLALDGVCAAAKNLNVAAGLVFMERLQFFEL